MAWHRGGRGVVRAPASAARCLSAENSRGGLSNTWRPMVISPRAVRYRGSFQSEGAASVRRRIAALFAQSGDGWAAQITRASASRATITGVLLIIISIAMYVFPRQNGGRSYRLDVSHGEPFCLRPHHVAFAMAGMSAKAARRPASAAAPVALISLRRLSFRECGAALGEKSHHERQGG